MKRIISLVLALCLLFAVGTINVFADTATVNTEFLEDGSYYVTIIETEPGQSPQPFSSTQTVTKSKTTYYKNANGATMWYVKVTGTFTYGNGSSFCKSYSPSAASKASTWKVSNISGSKSGNKASATATGKQYLAGNYIGSITKTVTLTCSSTGVFS